ncbi:MAG: TadE/TadG family type IV pilus assembly protein, partial [Pirellula staleyi]
MPSIRQRPHRFDSPKFRKGAHTVEFALVLPIMLLLFGAGIEFAR